MERLSNRLLPASAAAVLLLAACTGVAQRSGDGGSSPIGGAGGSPSAGGSSSAGAATGDLRYLVEAPEDPEALKPLEEHIGEFQAANPGITVTLEGMPTDTMRTVLQTQLRSGSGPDVFNWGSGPAYAGALAEAGLLYDLTAAYEERDWPIYDFAKERVTFDGKVVGVPGEMETIGIFYNKSIFSELGIEEPQNLDELDAAAQKARDADLIPFAVSDQEGWQGGHLLSMALSSRIGSEGMDALLTGETSWNSPDVVAALEVWQRFNEEGYLPPTPTSVSYDVGNALFLSGEAAMVPTGSWFIGEIEENVDFEVGYIPFPAEDGRGIFTGGLGSGPYVSANTEHPEAAIAFVDFLVSPEHGRWVVENLGTIPPYPVDTEGIEVSPLFAQVLEDTAELSGGGGDFGANIDVLATDEFNEAMWNGVQAIFTGQMTAQEVAESLEAAAAD